MNGNRWNIVCVSVMCTQSLVNGNPFFSTAELVKLLLEKEASIEARNKKKATPLDVALNKQVKQLCLTISTLRMRSFVTNKDELVSGFLTFIFLKKRYDWNHMSLELIIIIVIMMMMMMMMMIMNS